MASSCVADVCLGRRSWQIQAKAHLMDEQRKEQVVQTLTEKESFHRDWLNTYRTAENSSFDDIAFDYCAQRMHSVGGNHLLDAGCGTGHKCKLLAKRGFRLTGIDFSHFAISVGQSEMQSDGLTDQIELQHGDLTQLSWADNSFDHVLCWGVLMHIPDMPAAVAELARVVKPGGLVVISEMNCWAPENVFDRTLRTLLKIGSTKVVRTRWGFEGWSQRGEDSLVTRCLDVRAAQALWEENGLKLLTRTAGEFTQLYGRVPWSWLRRLIHLFNCFWFSKIGSPHLAAGNILVLQKSVARNHQ